MFKKVCLAIQNICVPAKISVILSSTVAIILILISFYLCFNDNLGLWAIYTGEMVAITSVRIFSMGIFCGLVGDFLVSAVDRKGK